MERERLLVKREMKVRGGGGERFMMVIYPLQLLFMICDP